jgi:hypothetical protein
LDCEIYRGEGFRKALASEEDQEAFDVIMDMSRNNVTAGGADCNPTIFEPMIMSICICSQEKAS